MESPDAVSCFISGVEEGVEELADGPDREILSALEFLDR